MTRVLLAPDKFKGTLTAVEVAAHLSAGIRAARPDIEVVVVPVSDGGDGLLDAARRAGFERVALRASGPTIRAARLATLSRVRAAYPLLPIDDATASCFARLADEQLRARRKPRRHDTWIAATALRHGAAVVTQDADFGHFSSVQIIRV